MKLARRAAIQEPSISAMLDWIRNVAPDLRMLRGTVDGRRVVAARFTFAGREHRYAATEGVDGVADAHDGVVRTCYVALARAVGMPTPPTGRSSAELEAAIVQASLAGHHDQADALGRELAVMNEEQRRNRATVRGQFGRRQAW